MLLTRLVPVQAMQLRTCTHHQAASLLRGQRRMPESPPLLLPAVHVHLATLNVRAQIYKSYYLPCVPFGHMPLTDSCDCSSIARSSSSSASTSEPGLPMHRHKPTMKAYNPGTRVQLCASGFYHETSLLLIRLAPVCNLCLCLPNTALSSLRWSRALRIASAAVAPMMPAPGWLLAWLQFRSSAMAAPACGHPEDLRHDANQNGKDLKVGQPSHAPSCTAAYVTCCWDKITTFVKLHQAEALRRD